MVSACNERAGLKVVRLTGSRDYDQSRQPETLTTSRFQTCIIRTLCMEGRRKRGKWRRRQRQADTHVGAMTLTDSMGHKYAYTEQVN